MMLPKQPDPSGASVARLVHKDSTVVRLRCIKWEGKDIPDEHIWASTDTSWIPFSYFSLNGDGLEQRKKLHYGKDLPINLSPFLKQGNNTLEIAIVRASNDQDYLKYVVGVEILGFVYHADVMDLAQTTNHLSVTEVKQSIRQKLAAPASRDDELTIIESNLTIPLFDPFSASSICTVPARGKACAHYECFDLATFLETRKRIANVTVADQWRCPICNGDARPQHLVVDGFLQEVHKKLAVLGLLHTRAIIVEKDGEWRPKPEIREGVRDPDTPDEDLPAGRGLPAKRAQPPAGAQVIDLSD